MKRAVLMLIVLFAVSGARAFAQKQEAVTVTPQGVQLDFQDADLRLVISALAEAGGLNVVYADLPSRRVTLRTTVPVSKENVGALIRSIAQSNGLTIVEEGSFIRLEAAASGAASTTPGAQGQQQEEARLFVYRLKHAKSARLASTLQALFGGGAPGQAAQQSRSTLSQRLRDQRVPPLDSARLPQVSVTLGAAAVVGSLPGELKGSIQIVPDEATNSLLVRAQPADWVVLQSAIQALDLRPLQVLIEVLIAEVRRTKDLNVGVTGKSGNGRGVTGNLDGTNAGGLSVELIRTGVVNVDVVLSALAATGDVRILSRPVVLAQNNQEAKILVGSERPFVQVSRSLPTDAVIRDQVVQYRDVGTSLTITPTINPDGYVNLQVSQEVSTATSEIQFGAPVISTREAATHLLARDGQTVIIGGLIDHERDQSRSGIPYLKDIPGLGVLFGSTRSNSTNTELFLFLTPHIIVSDEDADRLRDQIQQNAPMLHDLGPIRPLAPGATVVPRESAPPSPR